MVDSDLIHPFGYAAKQNRKIQPPLGFGNELSKWPKFLEKIINASGDDVFAGEKCFKTPPNKPIKNEFKVGQKLEAVDPKNPQLICPATVKELKRNEILISFDGWSQSSQFWCNYSSRDIFPANWCKTAGHILQMPGNLTGKKNNSTINTSPVNSHPQPSIIKKAKTKKAHTKKTQISNNHKNNESNESSDNSLNIANENSTNQTLNKSNVDSKPNMKNAKDTTLDEGNTDENYKEIDLSIVKDEAIDPTEFNMTNDKIETNNHLNNISLNTNGDLNKSSTLSNSIKNKSPVNGNFEKF